MTEIKLTKRYPQSRTEDITDAFMRGYEKGKADRPQGWIPCSERLPDDNREVLISLEWGIDIGTYERGEWRSEWINHYDDDNVLAWMPLPKPYKADRKTEPTISKMEQVGTMSCAECKHRPIGAEICEEPCHYEPQTDWHYDEQDATWYPYKHEDEPQQKSCATCKHALGNWDGESNNCGRCCGADRRFYEPKDESQTERSSE